MSDIIDSREILDELKTLDENDDIERMAEIGKLIDEVGDDNMEMGVPFIRAN